MRYRKKLNDRIVQFFVLNRLTYGKALDFGGVFVVRNFATFDCVTVICIPPSYSRMIATRVKDIRVALICVFGYVRCSDFVQFC